MGSDIGGTFTDLILASEDGQTFQVGKVLTTPDRPDDAVIAGIEAVLAAARVPAGRVSHVLHGTTLVTNAIIERKGARTALVTTQGFRDAVEIAREHRYDMYDLLPGAAAPARAAPPPLRGGRARAGRRHGEASGRPRRGAAPGGPAAVGGNRGGRRLPAARLRESRARAAGGRRSCGRRSRTSRSALVRGGPGDPRVRAHLDHARQRLRPAPGRALPGTARGPAARGRRRRQPLHHALQRRALRRSETAAGIPSA